MWLYVFGLGTELSESHCGCIRYRLKVQESKNGRVGQVQKNIFWTKVQKSGDV